MTITLIDTVTPDVGLKTVGDKINSNFTDTANAASRLTGLATGQLPTSDELSMVGETVNYTGANYQPNDSLGIGVVRYMQNNSGATHSNGQTGIAGSALNICFGVGSSGLWASSGVSVVGTWTQVAGNTVGDQNYGLYVRTA